MKKIKHLLFIFILLCTLTLLTGCSPETKLIKALDELQKSNYTIECNMSTEIELVAYGQKDKQAIEYEMLAQCDGNESYSEIVMDGSKVCSYVTIDGDNVKTYTNTNGTWIQGDDISLSEYKNDNFEMINIDATDCFEYEDDKWIGNTAELSKQLSEYMSDVFAEYSKYGLDIKNIIIDQYDITMDGKHIASIDLKMTMTMSATSIAMKVSITMPMKFSKIGETEITRPEI